MDVPDSHHQIMTPKDRLIRALTGQKPDVLPATPAYLCLFLADFERSFYIEQYRLRLRECGTGRYPIDHAEDTLFRARAIAQSYGIFKVRPDWIEADRGLSRARAARMDILERDGQLFYQDRLSGKLVAMHKAPLPRGDAELSEVNRSESDVLDLSAQSVTKMM
jgi:hypothetical protein